MYIMSINVNKETYTEIKSILSAKKYLKRCHISLDELSQKYKISTIPLRETLIRLSAEDIIDYEAGKGFYTKEVSLKSLKNDYHLLFNAVRWCIDCSLCEVNSCKSFLDWVETNTELFNSIEKDFNLYETTLLNSILCISGNERSYFLSNILTRTSIFRRNIHHMRSDILECTKMIIELSEMINNNNKSDTKKMLKKLEEHRIKRIQCEYSQLMSKSIEFHSI